MGALTGCGTKSSLSEAVTNSEKAGSSQTVATDGSTFMEKVIGFMSEAYIEEYEDMALFTTMQKSAWKALWI